MRLKIFAGDGYTPTGQKGARDLLVALKGTGRSIICLGKHGYKAFGHAMLNLVAPCIESQGHEAKLVTMLRDAGEEWIGAEYKRTSPIRHLLWLVRCHRSSQNSQSGTTIIEYWAYPVATPSLTSMDVQFFPHGPAYIPPPPEPPEPPEPHEQLEFSNPQPMHESLNFQISVDPSVYLFQPTAASPH